MTLVTKFLKIMRSLIEGGTYYKIFENNAVLNRGWRLFEGDTCYKISENNVVLEVIGIRPMAPVLNTGPLEGI